MALSKVTYVDGTTVIGAENLNAIQDEIISNAAGLTYRESMSNKVTALSQSSTDTQYPSAKCVYDLIGNVEALLEGVL